MIYGTATMNLDGKAQKETRIRFYKVLAFSAVLHGSETWVLTKRGENKIESTEVTFLQTVTLYTPVDRIKNEDIR